MQISNQTVEISEQAQTDGSQMKSIGLLTMGKDAVNYALGSSLIVALCQLVFLPATFVAVSNTASFYCLRLCATSHVIC